MSLTPKHHATAESMRRHAPRRRGMTLIEMTLTAFATSLALFLLVGWMGTVRQRAKTDLCLRLLADLDKALVRYKRAEGIYPAGTGDTAVESVLTALASYERTKPIFDAFPPSVWNNEKPRQLLDPWGTPMRYLADESKYPAVQVNGSRPIFASAGPDRDFGDNNAAAIGDNLRSDDPEQQGFRIHDTFRDALVDEEKDGGKAVDSKH